MKNINISAPVPFLLLLSILLTNSCLSCKAVSAPAAVLDTSGKLLRADYEYYIFPLSRRSTSGLDLINTENKTCPLHIVQRDDDITGIPMQFFPVNLKKGVIRVSTDLNIMFKDTWADTYTMCPERTIWKVDHYQPDDPLNTEYFVGTGGTVGNPGPDTLGNWFKIQKFGHGYKLVHCPSMCTYCDVLCKDVGIYVQNGYRRLALTNVPFAVVFKKA